MKTKLNGLDNVRRYSFCSSIWLPFLCLVLISAGCQQQVKQAADINPAGTYSLLSVDGKDVPCTVNHEGATLTVKSGTFVITADGNCVSKVTFTPPSGSDVTREVKASYSRQDSTLTMLWEGAGRTTGTLQGNTFTMNNEGMIFAYRK